jgi:hypothetical protein
LLELLQLLELGLGFDCAGTGQRNGGKCKTCKGYAQRWQTQRTGSKQF